MRRYLLLAAGMGSGHLQVARELARRLEARGARADVVDVLTVLPWRLGSVLRSGYAGMVRHAPWLYEAIYRGFFESNPGGAHRHPPSGVPALERTDPLVAASGPAVRRLVADVRPDAVVSTFHLAAQITGRLRARGELSVPASVVITEFAAHRRWLHPGNDAFVCSHQAVAAEAARRTGRPSYAPGPTVPPEFIGPGELTRRERVRAEFGWSPDRPVALVSAGAWGAGEVAATVGEIAGGGPAVVVLCGRNERLRRGLASRYEPAVVRPLGWRDDLPALLRAVDVLIENGGGQSAMEALAAGLPVITFAPLPGHGRAGAARMAELGLTCYVGSGSGLRDAVARLADPHSSERQRMVDAGRALFTGDAAQLLEEAAERIGSAATLR